MHLLLFSFSAALLPCRTIMKICTAVQFIALVITNANAFVTRSSVLSPSSSLSSSSLYAVKSKKDSYTITLLPGDGIGPEIMSATKLVLSALTTRCNFQLQMSEALIGGAAIDAVSNPFPPTTLTQCLASDSILLSCIGGYKWDTNSRELRPESGLLDMRQSLGLFANLRPVKVLGQLVDASTLKRDVVEGVDIMVVRELTGDVYFGTPKGIDIINGEFSLEEVVVVCREGCMYPLFS
jgi:3-isopropylmalate dehydrogenase